jgi:tRNA pseudouridine13 synthase
MRIALPLIGAKQKLSNGEMGEIEKKILREEGISNHTQWINPSSRLDTKGGLRPILTPLKDYKLQQASKESLTITFTLLRGCYATVLLREILKPVDVVAAGF